MATHKTVIPAGYSPRLSLRDTEIAIKKVKDFFERDLAIQLNLTRVSAPLFVDRESGLNDNLSGKERPVTFDLLTGKNFEIVHSLAKWKRFALKEYDFQVGEGLYTDMNAIRRDEWLDNVHSVYVDQWDWEKVITRETRNIEYLKLIVKAIVEAICNTSDRLKVRFPQLTTELCRDVSFITTQELEDLYPDMTGSERENAYLKEHKTAFIMQIGAPLRSGKPHDSRAPDYDDWQLNGDIFFWDDVLGRALEISSMGIRVDSETLDKQLRMANCDDRRVLPFHKMLLSDELPLTIGGGIGQSRLCMLMMGCAHIGEVQSSLWDSETQRICEENGIPLL